jgi:hypothetical protein
MCRDRDRDKARVLKRLPGTEDSWNNTVDDDEPVVGLKMKLRLKLRLGIVRV